jgi:hypothetical protein
MLLPKIIGIDLDNTIINYNEAFKYAAKKLDILSKDFFAKNISLSDDLSTKDLIKKHVLSQIGGKYNWESLQGQVYGNFIRHAKIFPGVANFLFHCNCRGIKVFVVSHKTKFGHHDEYKTSLRESAVNFLEHNNLLTSAYGLSKSSIFFLETRENKVRKIAELGCDYFIDDLTEVFLEPEFPKNTKQILFNIQGKTDSENTFNTWYQINKYFFDYIKLTDVSAYVESGLNEEVKTVKKIKGRANSIIFKIEMQTGKNYAAKLYPDSTFDQRERLEREAKAYRFMNSHDIDSVAKIIWFDINLDFGLYEWIDGLETKNITDEKIVEAVLFIQSLSDLSKYANNKDFDLASAGCLSGKMIEDQIWSRYKKIDEYSRFYPALKMFLDTQLFPACEKIIENSKNHWPVDFHTKLNNVNQVLSPSDFGFHNAIQTKDGLKFIDFEYFGWDDPVKLTCDFILHPGMKLTEGQKNFWLSKIKKIFSQDHSFQNRLNASYCLYGLCWCLIQLNIFYTINAEINKNLMTKEQEHLEKKQAEMLTNSKRLLKHLNETYKYGLPYK